MKNCNLCSDPADVSIRYMNRGKIHYESICTECLGEYISDLLRDNLEPIKVYNLEEE